MTANAWVDRYRVDWTDEELNILIAQPALALHELAAMPTDQALAALDLALSKLIVPCAQMRSGIRMLHAFGRVAAQQLFADERAFLGRLYAENPDPCVLPIKCISGLAGTGKTQLLLAFMRSLPPPTWVDVPNHARARLVAAHYLTAKAGVGIQQILDPVFRGQKCPTRDVVIHAKGQLARDSVAIVVGDELQFVSGDAALRVSNVLLQISLMGPAFAFACNFSLLHRLLVRPQEYRDRLLTDVIVLLPLQAESSDWKNNVRAVLAVDVAFSELAQREGVEIDFHRYTFGIKRHSRRLAVLSYGEARARGSNIVSIADVERAYLSLKYALARANVELLTAGDLGSLKNHKDLWCPLLAEGTARSGIERQAQAKREAALAEAAAKASMTRSERKGLASIQNETKPGKPEKPRRPKPDGALLRAGAKAYSETKKRTA